MIEKLNFKGFLDYEVTRKPFFGTKKRAREILSQSRVKILSHYDFIEYLQQNYSSVLPKIEYIRFYDFNFVIEKKSFHYTMAMVFTAADELARGVLYDDAVRITASTGWYPYITGSRANVKKLNYMALREQFGVSRKRIEKIDFGIPLKLTNISNTDTGSATLLQCYSGGILFDTGFGIQNEYVNQIDLICVSHFHKDHTGGLIELLHLKAIPVLISEVTLEYILTLLDAEEDKKVLVGCAVTLEEVKYYKNFRNHIDYFTVFHAPGAFGYVYKFYNKLAVIYLGDICICNAFYDYSLSLFETIRKISSDRKIIIFDGAIIGKKDGDISDDKPDDIVEMISLGLEKRNSIFVSQSAEMLIYSYILFFEWTTKNKTVKNKIVISDELYELLRTLWRPMVYRDNFNDLFIKHVFKGEANFVETFRLYPLSSLPNIKKTNGMVYFLTVRDIENNLVQINNSDVILAGIWTIRNFIPDTIVRGAPRSITRVSSSDWSFHSNEQDIVKAINILCSEKENEILLFHNYSKVLRKFIDKNLNGLNVSCVSKDGVEL